MRWPWTRRRAEREAAMRAAELAASRAAFDAAHPYRWGGHPPKAA